MEIINISIEVILLIGLSAICSGLNLSLMSLDLRDLKRKARAGNSKAKRILPFREDSHLSLVSILLTNVAVISVTSLTLEHHFNGYIAATASTLLIVIFGEMFPQAFFLKHSLNVTAFFIPFLRAIIIITYPISKPLQKLLDRLFKDEPYALHSRRELGLLISEHTGAKTSELDEHEVGIMKGALMLSEKRVRDIMTDLRHVYWLTPDSIIDADKIDEIKLENWSRIPILSSDRKECLGILLMKDLVDIDFDERAFSISELLVRPTKVVGSMMALDTLFRAFIGAHAHLMPVEKNDVIVGIVTIEDLIEEILGQEIEDESDEHRL